MATEESAMEISKHMGIGMVILGAGARFGGYAVLNRIFQPLRQAA